jgi:hypothetical protein
LQPGQVRCAVRAWGSACAEGARHSLRACMGCLLLAC